MFFHFLIPFLFEFVQGKLRPSIRIVAATSNGACADNGGIGIVRACDYVARIGHNKLDACALVFLFHTYLLVINSYIVILS